MKTTITIYDPNEQPRAMDCDLSEEPSYADLKAVIGPLFPDAEFEHVAVLFEDRRADMFVDEIGQWKGLPHNATATAIYRNNYLTRNPGTDPLLLPDITGRVILFDRIVWT